MEEVHSSSWTPTLPGLIGELKVAICSFLDARSAYKLGLTSTTFLQIIKTPKLRMHKKLFKLVTEQLTREDTYAAYKIINSSILLFPWYWKFWRKRSDYWNSIQEYTKGLQDLRKAHEVCPRASYRHLIKSDIYVTVSEIPQALEEIRKAIELKPNHLTYYHQRAYITSRQGMTTDDQEEEYLTLLEKNYKRQFMIHNNLAYCYFILERDDEALEHYDKALAMTPNFVRAILNKALLHLYRNEHEKVLEACKTLIQLNPELYEIYRDAAEVHILCSEYPRAIRNIQKSFHLSNRVDLHAAKIYFMLLDKMGKVDFMNEELDSAIELYQSQMTRVKDEISKITDDEMLVKAAEKKLQLFNGLLYFVLRRRSQSYIYQGEFEKAKNFYRHATNLIKNDTDAVEETDKFFDILFNQNLIDLNNAKLSTEVIKEMAFVPMLHVSEKKNFISQIQTKVTNIDDIKLFTLCLMKKSTYVTLFQLDRQDLRENDANDLNNYWTKVSPYVSTGMSLKLVAIERMGWETL